MPNKERIRLILLEGKSDLRFFNGFKEKYHLDHINIILLEARTLNFKEIDQLIEISRKKMGYETVWLIMDLKTQKLGTENYYSNKKELIAAYKKNLKSVKTASQKTSFAVMVKDLECWELVYFDKYNNTETIDDAEKEIKRIMGIKGTVSKDTLSQRLLKKPDFWEKLIQNKHKNQSLNDFVDAMLR